MLSDSDPYCSLLLMQIVSNDIVRVLSFPKVPSSWSNYDYSGGNGVRPKPDIIQEFLLIVDSMRNGWYAYPLFHIGLGQLVFDLDP